MMKIAMMTNNYKPFIGGVPISIERLTEGLRKEGHEAVVFAPTYPMQFLEKDIVRYHSLSRKMTGEMIIPNIFDSTIETKFREGKFDVIHVHHPMLIGNTAVYLSKKYKVPLVFTYHTRYEQYLHYVKSMLRMGEGTLQVAKEKIVPGYLRYYLKNCQHIFAPTESLRKYLVTVCKAQNEKVSVLPTGLKEESYRWKKQEAEALREKYGAENCPMFLTVSRLAQEKNIFFLLEALACYKQTYQAPFRMVFVGDGPDRKAYERKIQELNMEKEVFFAGAIANEELSNYYGAADLFLFASKTETQGIVILESMAAKTPVIALESTGVSDVVKNGRNGYCLKEDTEEFVSCIHYALSEPDLIHKLAKGAYETASQFHEERIAVMAVSVYEEVIRNQNHFGKLSEVVL